MNILAVIFILLSFGILSVSKGAIHEIEAILLMVCAMICAGSGHLASTMTKLNKQNKDDQ